jgi:hypothetical protein
MASFWLQSAEGIVTTQSCLCLLHNFRTWFCSSRPQFPNLKADVTMTQPQGGLTGKMDMKRLAQS